MKTVKENSIVNLTQRIPSEEQIADGVFHLAYQHLAIRDLQTFRELPTKGEMIVRAKSLALIAKNALEVFGGNAAMIGGAPYFMPHLAAALRVKGITPLYSFTVRQSEDTRMPDGSVKRTSIFKHAGWIEA